MDLKVMRARTAALRREPDVKDGGLKEKVKQSFVNCFPNISFRKDETLVERPQAQG